MQKVPLSHPLTKIYSDRRLPAQSEVQQSPAVTLTVAPPLPPAVLTADSPFPPAVLPPFPVQRTAPWHLPVQKVPLSHLLTKIY